MEKAQAMSDIDESCRAVIVFVELSAKAVANKLPDNMLQLVVLTFSIGALQARLAATKEANAANLALAIPRLLTKHMGYENQDADRVISFVMDFIDTSEGAHIYQTGSRAFSNSLRQFRHASIEVSEAVNNHEDKSEPLFALSKLIDAICQNGKTP